MGPIARRQFLQSLGTLAVGSTLAGCGADAALLHLQVLEGSLPAQAVGAFRRQLNRGQSVQMTLTPKLDDLLNALERLSESATDEPAFWEGWQQLLPGQVTELPELVTLGDTWLAQAIAAGLLQPYDESEVPPVAVPSTWAAALRRDEGGQPAPDGRIWGVPYRWGTAVIAYRRDKLAWQPSQWADLWHPDLRDRLSLPDEPRLPIGLTLKMLGASLNAVDPQSVADLPAQLGLLHQQTKFYSSDRYLQPLVLGDTWAAVGWSADVLAAMRQYANVAVVIPQEGTALWADLWVRPQPAEPTLSPLAANWLTFCTGEETARWLPRFSHGTSPAEFPATGIPELEGDRDAIERSEWFLPQAPAIHEQYRRLWVAMRQGEL